MFFGIYQPIYTFFGGILGHKLGINIFQNNTTHRVSQIFDGYVPKNMFSLFAKKYLLFYVTAILGDQYLESGSMKCSISLTYDAKNVTLKWITYTIFPLIQS